MPTVVAMNPPGALARWRELVWPREHGSWSLAFEPLALGLLVAPSLPGVWFARRPDLTLRRKLLGEACGGLAARRGYALAVAAGLFSSVPRIAPAITYHAIP